MESIVAHNWKCKVLPHIFFLTFKNVPFKIKVSERSVPMSIFNPTHHYISITAFYALSLTEYDMQLMPTPVVRLCMSRKEVVIFM